MFRRIKGFKWRAKTSRSQERKMESASASLQNAARGQIKSENFNGERMIYLFPAPLKEIGGNLWGYINAKGKFILPPVYDYAGDFQENGLAIVNSKGKSGVINYNGYFIVKPIYDAMNPFAEGRAVVKDQQGFKVIDERGKEVTAKAYSDINDYREGRALFADTTVSGGCLYGYLNKRGKEVLPAAYEEAADFVNGKAIVKMKGGPYALINLTGKVLCTYPYPYVGSYNEGLLSFQKSGTKFGYVDEQGTITIEPRFQGAQPFREGRAIVDVNGRYALIDRNGTYIFKPSYHHMMYLGEGRIALGKAFEPEKIKYAVADAAAGFILTGFIYNGLTKFTGGRASAYNDQASFFINKQGNRISDLPIVDGGGELYFSRKLIKAEIDERLFYFEKNGEPVWKPNTEIFLNNQYAVQEKKYKPNKDYLIYYPQVSGMADKKTQAKINQTLKDLAGVKETHPHFQLESNYRCDFSIPFYQRNLLVVKMSGCHYSLGASRGLPVSRYAHIDLKTGEVFQLAELFKSGSQYVKMISEIIGSQIKNERKHAAVFQGNYKGIQADQAFFIRKDSLNIYFSPYEIAPSAGELPIFSIPFADLLGIIDQNGAFWKSFE